MSGLIYTNIPYLIGEKEMEKRYGISYNVNDSNPSLTRLYDAYGMVANAGNSLTDTPRNDFDLVYPFNKITQETIIHLGSSSNIMIKIPKFYIRRELVGNVMEIVICGKKYDKSYIPHEMFLKGNVQWTGNNPETDYNDFTYISRYELTSSGLSCSKGGKFYSNSIYGFRNDIKVYVANIWLKGWSILDIVSWDGLQKLFMIVFATRNSNNALGANDNQLTTTTGKTDNAKATCVYLNEGMGQKANSFYGVENIYGNGAKIVDGAYFSSTGIYVSTNISKYSAAYNTTTNLTFIQSNYILLNYEKITSAGYISKLGFDTNNKFAQTPIEINGSSTTYFTGWHNGGFQSGGWMAVGGGYSSTGDQKQSMSSIQTNLAETFSTGMGTRVVYRPI